MITLQVDGKSYDLEVDPDRAGPGESTALCMVAAEEPDAG